MKIFLALAMIVLFGPARPSPGASSAPDFDAYWHDGRAELDGYRIIVNRYGHPRRGRGVMITVTEPFSRSRHVKLERPSGAGSDSIDVLKLNLVRDFQTGIYDYHTMVSLFVNSRDLSPVKVAFSSSEWCGQVYEELDVRGSQLSQQVSSYFEGESSKQTLPVPASGIQEDELFIRLRGLRGPYLRPGETRKVPFLASPFYRRLAHRAARWAPATIERRPRPETVVVPAGSFATDAYIVRPADGRVGRFFIERAHPHRIVRWSWDAAAGRGGLGGTDGGELTGSTRLEYWRTHDPGDERLLSRIGLGAAMR